MKQRSYISRVALALIAFFAIGLTAYQVPPPRTCGPIINCSFEEGNFRGYHPLDKLRLPDRPPVDSGKPLNKLELIDGGSGPPPPPPSGEVVRSLPQEGMLSQQLARTDDHCPTDPAPLDPRHGDFFAILNTVRDTEYGLQYRLRQSVVVQESFVVPQNETELLVDLNFLTNEFDIGLDKNDTASVYLTNEATGDVVKVAFFSRHTDLQDLETGQPRPGTVCEVGGFVISTGWRTFRVNVAQYRGRKVFLTFNVRKASTLDDRVCHGRPCNTALAIDNIGFLYAVPK